MPGCVEVHPWPCHRRSIQLNYEMIWPPCPGTAIKNAFLHLGPIPRTIRPTRSGRSWVILGDPWSKLGSTNDPDPKNQRSWVILTDPAPGAGSLWLNMAANWFLCWYLPRQVARWPFSERHRLILSKLGQSTMVTLNLVRILCSFMIIQMLGKKILSDILGAVIWTPFWRHYAEPNQTQGRPIYARTNWKWSLEKWKLFWYSLKLHFKKHGTNWPSRLNNNYD